jgi:hypothetical protein
MPQSLAGGDYSLIMAIESATRPNSWYRVCHHRGTGALSCDCPAWTFQRDSRRACKHVQTALTLLSGVRDQLAGDAAGQDHPLICATCQQWPGLGGSWAVAERDSRIGSDPYHFVALTLRTGNGDSAIGCVAFAQRHNLLRPQTPSIAGWAGYAIAAEVCRRGNLPLAGAPPAHFTVTRSRRAGRMRDLGLSDILRIGDQVELGDGLKPEERAENTLRLFLGPLYATLERQHFLDVSSVLFPGESRVYRLRRDPLHCRERRLRIFAGGEYVRDFCIVRQQLVPEADHYLTLFLRLLSDEAGVLDVVKPHNIFPPHSDDYHQRDDETEPALWLPRAA